MSQGDQVTSVEMGRGGLETSLPWCFLPLYPSPLSAADGVGTECAALTLILEDTLQSKCPAQNKEGSVQKYRAPFW